ncbi:MAG: hypothetical protein IJ489_09475 [Clostridia bacterium]|nr:hypothetical protein [Clostridia bacterium]
MKALLADHIRNKAENTVRELYKCKLYAKKQSDASKALLDKKLEENPDQNLLQTEFGIDSCWEGCATLLDSLYETAVNALSQKMYCQILFIPVGKIAVLLVDMKKIEKNRDVEAVWKDYFKILNIHLDVHGEFLTQKDDDCPQDICCLIKINIKNIYKMIYWAKTWLILFYEQLTSSGSDEADETSEWYPTFYFSI